MKILICCASSLGDVLFSTPLIRALKVCLDDPEIHYALPKRWQPALQENPYVDKIVAIKGLHRYLGDGYDYMVDLGFHFWLRLGRFAGVPVRGYTRPWWQQWLLVNMGINKLKNVHVVDRMMQTVAPLGVYKDALGLDYFIPDSDVVPPEWLPPDFQKGFVLFSLHAPYSTRKLPVERMIELCDRINKPVVLVGDKSDIRRGEEVARFFQRSESGHPMEEGLEALNKKAIVYNGCGKFNMNQVASLVQQAARVFTFDSDIVAVASAFRKPVCLVLGNTVSLFGRYPYHTKFVVLENNKVHCRPCTSRGFSKCPKGHFKCMREVGLDF